LETLSNGFVNFFQKPGTPSTISPPRAATRAVAVRAAAIIQLLIHRGKRHDAIRTDNPPPSLSRGARAAPGGPLRQAPEPRREHSGASRPRRITLSRRRTRRG